MNNEDYFICPYCNHKILSSNQVIHEARCQRMQNTVASVRSESQNFPQKNSYHENFQPPPTQEKCNQCGETIPSSRLAYHKQSECQGHQIPCEFCNEMISIAYHNLHSNSCPQNPKNKKIEPDNVLIPCEFCGKGINHLIYENHAEECQRMQQNNLHSRTRNYDTIDSSPPGDIYENYIERDQQDSINFIRGNRTESQLSEMPSVQTYQSRNPTYQTPDSNFQNSGYLNQFSGRSPFGSYTNPFLNPNTELLRQSHSSRTSNTQQQQQQQQQRSSPTLPRFPGGSMIIQTLRRQPDGRTVLERRTVPLSVRNDSSLGPLSALFNMFNLSFNGLNVMSLDDLSQVLSNGSNERGLDRESLNSFAVIKYDKQKSEHLDVELKKCAICLSEFEDDEEIKFLLCTHRFHSTCIDPWLEKHTTCPICKKDFSQMQVPDS